MSDLIDRQAIFKKVEKIRQGLQMMDDTRRASIIMNGLYLCEKEVRNLPSAQPEIIRCKDCKHYPGEYADCPMIGWARNENDFCSKAEWKES